MQLRKNSIVTFTSNECDKYMFYSFIYFTRLDLLIYDIFYYKDIFFTHFYIACHAKYYLKKKRFAFLKFLYFFDIWLKIKTPIVVT